MRGALGDPLDLSRRVAVEDRRVLGQRDARARLFEAGEVEVRGAPLGVVDLAALHHEVGAQLHQGQHAALRAGDVGRGPGDRRGAPQGGGRVRPAQGAVEVDELAGRQVGLEAGPDLVFDGLPSRVGDGGELPEEVVHDSRPFRLPMPSDPDARRRCRSGPTLLRPRPRSRVMELGGEQIGAQVLVERRVAASEPLEGHRGVLFLLVAVVGEDVGQAGVGGGLDPLVVPVDGLELLAQRGHGPVVVDGVLVEELRRFVQPFARHVVLLSLVSDPGARSRVRAASQSRPVRAHGICFGHGRLPAPTSAPTR